MFAIVRTGGKQYRVAPGDKIVVEKLAGAAGDTITLDDVLLAGNGGDLQSTDGLAVEAEIIAQAKADKVIVFKKRRRHNYRRKNGHRQQHTILRITAVGGERAEQGATKAAAPAPQQDDAGSAPQASAPSAGEAAPAKKPRAKKAAAGASDAPQPAAPLKTEGQESVAVDAPAPDTVADRTA